MDPTPIEAFFSQRASQGNLVVSGAPRFDLESYISNYYGRTQIDRLFHIGTTSVPLAVEALKLAVARLKQSSDVQRYRTAVGYLQKVAPADPDAVVDEEWVNTTQRRVQAETEKIEAALKSYKHNLIKESIRMGHEELGNHYYKTGDLTNAFRSYSRMRDFCTIPKHILDMSQQIIRVCIEQGNYMGVQSQIVKIKSTMRSQQEEDEHKPKLCVSNGLAHLSNGAYREAARAFLECPPALGDSFSDIIAAADVAVYGGLCALASMNRVSLKKEVLENNDFRQFLELQPQMRRAISYFHAAKYSACLHILEEYKNDYLLDVYLARHVDKIYESIRSKGIVQYFIPFACVTLESMAEAFATNEQTLEKELVKMIGSGALDARIDTKNRLLVAKESDTRSAVHRDTLAMAQGFERTTRLRLARFNIIRAGLEVKAPKPQQNQGDFWGPTSGFAGAASGGFGGAGPGRHLRSGSTNT